MDISGKHQEIRRTILDSTERILSSSSYKKMTIDILAQEAEIGKGSIYLYFASKEEIVLSHFDRIAATLKENLRDIASENYSPVKRLKKMFMTRALFYFDIHQKYAISFSELSTTMRPQLLQRQQLYYSDEAKIFAEIISEGKIQSDFICGDELEVAKTILTAGNSLLPLSLSGLENIERAEVTEKFARLATLLLRGLLI